MEIIFRHFLLIALLSFSPQFGKAAASKTEIGSSVTSVNEKGSTKKEKTKWRVFKSNLKEGRLKLKDRIFRWVSKSVLAMPTGKLLTSLVLLLLAIIILAISGVIKFGLLFGIIGSVSLVLALVFFLLWLGERSKSATVPVN